ncbi:MAG: DUF362 domain-containing protein [Ignavibacteriales bacterium]|nr:DUF362 domain-containing protein [Ignavibacteriales bacterium]MCF8307216.1 DUF362 domain-containing protein [Ignavibacteriales bacterium]MCF8315221.1 DUF362 domain-containing protein [Ignavibacteriales bacterium]MCF8438496.1 DUF362 domain-containing protein [Ignavibacteriales bacterium]
MRRRDFIYTSVLAGAALSTIGLSRNVLAGGEIPDLVAVRNGDPDIMFEKAIAELGGMKKFVRPNQRVVIKPNIGWDVSPERAANTNPRLVARIIKHCLDAGAKEVVVFDNTCDNWKKCYSNSLIEKYVNEAGGKMVPGNSEGYYQSVKIPAGSRIKDAKVHELILDSDVFINVPILKSHGGARLTVSMKNLMGIVWDRGYWHRNDLHTCIAEFSTFRKPDLNIVDAWNVMQRNGPRGLSEADTVMMKSLLISRDMVTADTAAAKLLGFEAADVRYIEEAAKLGVGRKDLEKLNIRKIML